MNSTHLARAIPIALAITSASLAVPLLGLHGARTAEASCMAPRVAFVREVRVTRCELIDPMQQPAVSRYVASINSNADSRQFVDGYRGIVLDGDVLRSVQRPANARPPARSVSAFPLGAPGANAVFFRPTRDANACNAFRIGRVVSVYELSSCCDGDPGVPCLLRGGITRALRSTP